MQRCEFGVVTTLLILAAAALVAAGGCSDPTIYETTIIVSGVVVDHGSELPVDSAWIVAGDTITARKEYTDSLGQFALPFGAFPGGFRVLFAGKNGYRTGIDTVRNAADDVTDVRIELEPGGN